ncbi:hypothetical protein GF366_01295, partial [Candidatus Peregrinibacteria bacterium]|nr:hypothetical protein [Candidatus Peregrinibacteria bacterium]
MAVIIDRSFWNSMAKMDQVKHLSNCDIVWFIMNYRSNNEKLDIYVEEIYLTTLDDAVTG